ncbi:MAG: hypothetical protein E7599_04215 [Ruminococcaceae bacterium]|nr:hypothetical protein [Oscillospiraceae bacterium]
MPSAIRHFIIAFIIAVLIFSIAGAVMLGWFGKAVRENEKGRVEDNTGVDFDSDDDEDADANTHRPTLRGQSFSMLLILNDYQPDRYEYGIPDHYDGIFTERLKQAVSLVYLRFSREAATLYTSVIPAQTLINAHGVSMTAAEAYHYFGAEHLCDRISSLLGTRINYYCDATYDQFVSLIDGPAMNGVNFTVPEQLQVSLRSGTKLTLEQGTQFMDGERLLALLSAGNEGGYAWYRQVQASLAHKLLEKLTTLEHKRNPKAFYQTVLSKLATNLSEELVAAGADMMFAYFDLKQEELIFPGEYDKAGNYLPDRAQIAELYRTGAVLE